MTEMKQTFLPPDLVQLSRKLETIGKIEKCEGCSCYVDTIKEFDAVLNQSNVQAPDEVRRRIGELEAKHQTTHGCIGCDPCYPVAVSNALYEISGGEGVAGCGPSCECEPLPAQPTPIVTITKAVEPAIAKRTVSWPIETGDYRLGNLSGCVAVVTLASEDLYQKFSANVCAADCSICGKVFTENIGIEKVIKNIISNRHIRFLILCGQEAKGHLTGACVKAIHAHGIDERERIREAPGKRPWIKTLTLLQIARFQQQVEIVDLIGCEDVSTIETKIGQLAARNPGPMRDDLIAEGMPHYVAEGPVKLQLDRAGFLIIHPKPEANWIFVEHYKNTGEPTCVVEGFDPARLCAELIQRGLVSQLDHAAYLGRELERAKLSMQLGFPFAQDRALGELDNENNIEW